MTDWLLSTVITMLIVRLYLISTRKYLWFTVELRWEVYFSKGWNCSTGLVLGGKVTGFCKLLRLKEIELIPAFLRVYELFSLPLYLLCVDQCHLNMHEYLHILVTALLLYDYFFESAMNKKYKYKIQNTRLVAFLLFQQADKVLV